MDLEKQLKIATEENNVDALSKRLLRQSAVDIECVSHGVHGNPSDVEMSRMDARKLRRIAAIALAHAAKLEGDV